MEYLIRGSRYASCVHAGVSCLKGKFGEKCNAEEKVIRMVVLYCQEPFGFFVSDLIIVPCAQMRCHSILDPKILSSPPVQTVGLKTKYSASLCWIQKYFVLNFAQCECTIRVRLGVEFGTQKEQCGIS